MLDEHVGTGSRPLAMTVAADLRSWPPFLALVVLVSALKLALAGAGGAVVTWLVILVLWGIGAVWAGFRDASATGPPGGLIGNLALQNLCIQLFVAVPSLAVGTWRLAAPGGGDVVFWGNVVATLVVVPLLSGIVLSFVGLIVAVPVARLVAGVRGSRAIAGIAERTVARGPDDASKG